MTKLDVYIDFEAISMPFSREIDLPSDFPYAYTLGIYKGKKFKTRTFIFNFQKDNVEDIRDILRSNIVFDIRTLLENKEFRVNPNTVKFIGWSPILEKKILNGVFTGIEVDALNKGFEISLSRLTPEFEGEYFMVLKTQVLNSLDKDFIERRNLMHDGALAALSGYILKCQAANFEGKYFMNIDTRTLLREIREYSEDDVLRMAYLNDNRNVFDERRDKAQQLITDKQRLIKEINKLQHLTNSLTNIDKEATVEVVISDLQKNLKKLVKEKEKVEKEFDNI